MLNDSVSGGPRVRIINQGLDKLHQQAKAELTKAEDAEGKGLRVV